MFDVTLRKKQGKRMREQYPVSWVMIDIDSLKAITIITAICKKQTVFPLVIRYPDNIYDNMKELKMTKIEGGCLCGHIRYTCDVEPLMTVICHCKNCQIQSGTAFSTNIILPKGALAIEGEMAVYTDTGDTGNKVNRYFCRNCGSPVISEADVLDNVSVLKAGTLDDTSWVTPTTEIYCDSAQKWTKIEMQLESHPNMMPS